MGYQMLPTSPTRGSVKSRVVPRFAAAAAIVSAQPLRPATFDLEEATVADLQRRMDTRQETSRTLVDKYLAHIDAIDRNGPALHSVLELNPDAGAIADALDAERRAGHVRGPLHGIPVLIKDNIATHDRMMTTAGSLALAGAPAPKDAFIVERLRAAGVVILGKTNLSEWANFRSTHSSSGWSGRGGQTKNPACARSQSVRIEFRIRAAVAVQSRRHYATGPLAPRRTDQIVSAVSGQRVLVGIKAIRN